MVSIPYYDVMQLWVRPLIIMEHHFSCTGYFHSVLFVVRCDVIKQCFVCSLRSWAHAFVESCQSNNTPHLYSVIFVEYFHHSLTDAAQRQPPVLTLNSHLICPSFELLQIISPSDYPSKPVHHAQVLSGTWINLKLFRAWRLGLLGCNIGYTKSERMFWDLLL